MMFIVYSRIINLMNIDKYFKQFETVLAPSKIWIVLLSYLWVIFIAGWISRIRLGILILIHKQMNRVASMFFFSTVTFEIAESTIHMYPHLLSCKSGM